MIKVIIRINKCMLMCLMILIFISVTLAQQEAQPITLTRGKLWFCSLPNGSVEHERERFINSVYDAYPGGYDQNNDITGGPDGRIFNVARIAGEEVGWEYRPSRTISDVYEIEPPILVKNYNLIDPILPEEYFYGVIGSYELDAEDRPHMAYELYGTVMVWSLPKYDDFVIIKCKLTNADTVTFEDYYYTRQLTIRGPGNPLGASYDIEYLWEDDVSEDIGFIYYDDTSWDPNTGEPTIYQYHPGNISGDRGDPGNIKVQGSTDKRLYSPHLYAFSFLKYDLTPNKYGEKKVWRSILSRSGSAPFADKFPGNESMQSWSVMVDVLSREQPKIDWRDAHETYQLGDLAGSLYERNPLYLYAIGPYDIAPGESIEWIEIWVAGQMDRNITILGDTTATLHFVEEGLVNLKENWFAAKELIENNFQVPGGIPPPTPADVPSAGNESELIVEAGAGTVDGKTVSGVYLTWGAVHQGYTDPLTGQADFAKYYIYQSDISYEGPWTVIDSLSKNEAEALVENGKVTFFKKVDVGVPYRYCVSSVDQEGNESAMTAYNVYPVTADIVPTNDMSSIYVVPNPFRQQSGFRDPGEKKRMAFINIPAKCTIRIYTLALELIKTIEHNGGGATTWGTSSGENYMLTDFAMNVMPGVYVYHVESRVAGHEGESTVGKFVIIK